MLTRRSTLKNEGAGKLSWRMQSFQTMPQILGIADPVRYLQLLPGMQASGELSSGIFMQGCETSHNEITLNGAPLYNAMHLMGFFSVFNTGHMRDFTIQKSNLSAAYSNKLGGALSMQSLDSVTKRFSVEGNVGIISSQGTVAMPIDSTSALYVSARCTYINLLYKSLLKIDNSELQYGFQDYNATYINKISARDKLVANFYYGSDCLQLEEGKYLVNGTIDWSNTLASLNWTRKGLNDWAFQHLIYFSHYKNGVDINQSGVNISLPSSVSDYGYKGEAIYTRGMFNFIAGIEYIYHSIDPQIPIVEGSYNQTNEVTERQQAHESSGFVSSKLHLSSDWELEVGLRGTVFLNTTKDQAFYRFSSLDPRLTCTFFASPSLRIVGHYGIYHQYIHQICSSSLGLPTDFWMPSSQTLLPQKAHNFTIGAFQTLGNGGYNFSVEGYFKKMSHQVEYNGSLFEMINRQYVLADALVFGKGKNYGVDFMLRKNYGKLTGWISYTLAWAKRNFPLLNGGATFPSSHDRRHNLSVVMMYKLAPRLQLTALFVYASGVPYTAPSYAYMVGENVFFQYESHNASRMSDYHRLDLSLNYYFKKESMKENGLNFSIYNAYNRKNPFFMDIDVDNLSFTRRSRYLYRIVPSISYFFKF